MVDVAVSPANWESPSPPDWVGCEPTGSLPARQCADEGQLFGSDECSLLHFADPQVKRPPGFQESPDRVFDRTRLRQI